MGAWIQIRKKDGTILSSSGEIPQDNAGGTWPGYGGYYNAISSSDEISFNYVNDDIPGADWLTIVVKDNPLSLYPNQWRPGDSIARTNGVVYAANIYAPNGKTSRKADMTQFCKSIGTYAARTDDNPAHLPDPYLRAYIWVGKYIPDLGAAGLTWTKKPIGCVANDIPATDYEPENYPSGLSFTPTISWPGHSFKVVIDGVNKGIFTDSFSETANYSSLVTGTIEEVLMVDHSIVFTVTDKALNQATKTLILTVETIS